MILGILSAETAYLFFMMLLISFYLALSIRKAKNHHGVRIRLLNTILFIIFFFCGLLKMNSEMSRSDLETYLSSGSNAQIQGKISKITFSNGEYSYFLYDSEITDTSTEGESYGIIVISSDYVGKIGDYINAEGVLYPCEGPRNPGQFDSKKYYRARNIDGKLYADIIDIEYNDDSIYYRIKDFVFRLSLKFREGLFLIFPEKEAGILTAMLTGEKGEIDEEVKDSFGSIGIAHILSISGLHVSLLGMGLFGLIMKITKRLKLSSMTVLVFMFFYGMLTGFSVSTLRAVIMVYCMLIGRLILKSYDGQSAAALAGIIILISNPYSLQDSGFLLSFTAVFGIFAGNSLVKYLEIENRPVRYLIPGLFAQLGSFPVVLYCYYFFSPYSILANLILLPFMSIILISGLIGGIFGGFCLVFPGKISGGAAFYILKGYEKISKYILELPKSQIITGCPTGLRTGGYYIVFFFIIAVSRKLWIKRYRENDVKISKEKKHICFYKLIPVMIIPMIILLKRPASEEFEVDFLDVGQGMCVFINCDEGRLLIDGGSANIKQVGKYRIEPFLKYYGIETIDCVFITHTDSDHTSGIEEIIDDKSIKLEKIYISEKTDYNDSLVRMIENNKISLERIEEGFEWNNTIKCLAPSAKINYPDANSASLVLLLENNNFRAIFTGDADFFSEYIFMDKINEPVNLLQVGHHGSKNSTSKELLERLYTDVAVISCSRKNSYGHPSPELLERLLEEGISIYKTFESGMIGIGFSEENEYFTVSKYID